MSRAICKAICRACPFRRTSASGWLGESSDDPQDFLSSFAYGEAPLPCHKQVAWEREDAQAQAADAPLCRGALTMMRNSAKLPRDPELAAAVKSVTANCEDIFLNAHEFVLHHSKE